MSNCFINPKTKKSDYGEPFSPFMALWRYVKMDETLLQGSL